MDLPGESSQLKMAPASRLVEQKHYIKAKGSARQAAVMVMLYGFKKDLYIALIKRTSNDSVHSGQIALPGGEQESSDKDLLATVKREVYEEIGVNPDSYKVLRPLTDIYIPPSNFYVQPYLSICKEPPVFYKQDTEVAEVLQMPIEQLLEDKYLIQTQLMSAYDTVIDVPAFKMDNHIVWGATAMILYEVRDLLKYVQQIT